MKESNKDLGELFIRYRDQQDIRAFDQLLENYNQALYNYLLRILRSKEDAEDALQEVWIKVVRQGKHYKEKGRFSSWLFCIAHNHCLDLFRKRSYRIDSNERVETNEGYSLLSSIPSKDPSPYDAMVEKEINACLEKAVDQLPVLIKEVYLLRTVHGIPFKEIVEIQQAPLGTVLSRMHQAIQRLKPLIEQYMEIKRSNEEETAKETG